MTYKNYLLYISICLSLISCTDKVSETWTIDDFSKTHKFELKVPENVSVNNANIFLDGEFSGDIYMSKIENDSTMHFTNETLPDKRIFTDFYGEIFKFYTAPSNAKGSLEITIEIPYSKDFF